MPLGFSENFPKIESSRIHTQTSITEGRACSAGCAAHRMDSSFRARTRASRTTTSLTMSGFSCLLYALC